MDGANTRSMTRWLFSAFFLVACSNTTIDGDGEGGNGGQGGEGNGGSAAVCPEEPIQDGSSICRAPIKTPCAFCDSDGQCDPDDEETAIDRARATCVLEALRDRTRGTVLVQRSPDGGYCGRDEEVAIVGDEAWITGIDYVDEDYDYQGFAVKLKSAAFYQGCIDAATDGAFLACFDSLWEKSEGCPGNCCATEEF